MLTTSRTRTIAAPADQLWRVVSDPHHLPRWWPRVTRVEGVDAHAFTEVMRTRKGKTVRADFDVVAADEASGTVRWDQRIEGTPFAMVLSSAQTEVRLQPSAPASTQVTIELRQALSATRGGFYQSALPSLRGRMVTRAAVETLEEALAELERISV